MNTPISWLKVYVPDLDVDVQDFVDAMTLSGSHVEGYEKKDKNLEKIVAVSYTHLTLPTICSV